MLQRSIRYIDAATPAPRPPDRRGELTLAALAYVLRHGLGGLALRPLAADLGTSDRMLLYYFRTRDGLVAAVLEATADRLRALVTASLPPGPLPPAAVLQHALRTTIGDAEARDLLRLWIEVLALAARGDAVCATTAQAVTDDWVAWLADRLDVPAGQERAAAAGLLAVVDGLVMMDVADGLAGDAAAWLLSALR